MKFEEPTLNTDISGKTKMIRLYIRITIILMLKNKFVFKDDLRPHLRCHDYNDDTTLLFYLLPIDFDMVRLLN